MKLGLDNLDKWPMLLTSTEVGDLFRVDRITVARWRLAGKIEAVKTLGGHLRFRREDVYELLKNHTEERQ